MKKLLIIFLCWTALQLSAQNNALFFYMNSGKFGFVDASGKPVIPATFSFAANFSEGLAVAAKGDNTQTALKGYINSKGVFAIPPAYTAAGDFSEGLARVQVNGKWGYIDKNGKMVISPQFQLCYEFKNGYAQAQQKNLWGLIDKTGKFVIKPTYYSLTDYSGKVLGAQKTMYNDWMLMDIHENSTSLKGFSKMGSFGNGLAPARNVEDKWGFINEKAEWVIQPKYSNAHIFSDYLAAVEVNFTHWGFINTSGEMIIEPQYDRPSVFKNSIAQVEKGDNVLLINPKSATVYQFKK
ncbi:MAG: WG repeat-containing protein [Chitinophagales bacterium]